MNSRTISRIGAKDVFTVLMTVPWIANMGSCVRASSVKKSKATPSAEQSSTCTGQTGPCLDDGATADLLQPLMRSRQKAREPTPGMPLGEEQENSNTTETMPYGLRQSTLTARSAEPNLTHPKKKCPNSRPQGTTDNVVSRDLVKETAQRLQEEDGERDSVPMPPVSKSRNARSGDNPVTAGTIGLGNPSARADLEPVRTASGGIKRNREVASDPDDTVPSRKIMRSQSPSPDAGEETNSLRQSVSGTTFDWHANNAPSPSQSQDAAGSQGEYSGDGKTPHPL
ncbi:hypothetical protein F5887DRAFT_921196 [Amanita rubescens]|nr:hypothetical protein F5887DRAFT_921196 [Amanita rubescens]